MQVGDLVRRKNIWHEWQRHNSWMKSEKYTEIGIVVKSSGGQKCHVLWSSSSISCEDKHYLIIVKEKLERLKLENTGDCG